MKNILVIPFLLTAIAISSCNKEKVGYTVPVIDPTNSYDHRSVGVSANDFLSSKKYKVINLEICYVRKHELPKEVVDNAIDFLNTYCNKPDGIRVSTREIADQGGDLGVNNLIAIEEDFRTKFEKSGQNGKDTLGLFVYVSESFYYERDVLGIAFRNTALALFDGTISDVSGGIVQPSREDVLSTVLKHEIGHLLGLVDIGSPMQTNHLDEGHGKHCNNSNCLMYYTMQTKSVIDVLLKGLPELDDNCKADLRANGGK